MEDGGEGIILRKIGSYYEPGRTNSLIKLKGIQVDREAIVVERTKSKVKLKLPEGKTFDVPLHEVQTTIPEIGDVVTFTYEKNSRRDIPVRPKIVRSRTDVSWEEILKSASFHTTDDCLEVPIGENFTTQPMGHWTAQNMRLYLESFFRRKNMDPLVALTWYSTTSEIIRSTKAGRTILEKFRGGYWQMLRSLFPEISFDFRKFDSLPSGHWIGIENRRKFFENFAADHGFDPHNPLDWYSQDKEKILLQKGAARVVFYHENNVAKALLDLFPNIGLEKSKLTFPRPLKEAPAWSYKGNRRAFFEEYAKENNFDPLIAENWFKQFPKKIMAKPDAGSVMSFHSNSVSKALLDLFPSLTSDKSHFRSQWNEVLVRKKFFKRYARDRGFDAHDPVQWYKQSKNQILSTKGAKDALHYYKGSLANALLDLFPNIGLDPMLLHFQTWRQKESRRFFFVNFSQKKEFDPLIAANWYRQSLDKIMQEKGAKKVLKYHNHSVVKALLDLFPEIGLEPALFRTTWRKNEKRRKFMELVATKYGFDPLSSKNWLESSFRRKFLQLKGAREILSYHGSLKRAFFDLFPEAKQKSSL
eukprot:Phypoly_transcript_05386.p1 GENE.Phypoly_transcript_05386~~Phypoly_transcript_05386.p1  ORF type:complete len:586 (+),score=95.25 Phypoly_transcript_05386:3-1760(+)